MTSVFTATFVTRGIVNLIYGSRRRLDYVPIGKIWIPEQNQATHRAALARNKAGNEALDTQKRVAEQLETKTEIIQEETNLDVQTESSERKPGKTKNKRKSSDIKQSKS